MTENEIIEFLDELGGGCSNSEEYIACNTAIKAIKEVSQYQTLEKRLAEMFGDQLSLETVVDEMERQLKEPGNPHPINAKILTYEDAKAWEEYKTIGTPEEYRVAVEKQTAKKPMPINYEKYANLVDNAIFLRDAYWCPHCKHVVKSGTFCRDCGQKLDWRDEE